MSFDDWSRKGTSGGRPSARSVAFVVHHKGQVILKTDYIEDFVEDLKEMVSWRWRSWNTRLRCWTVDEEACGPVLKALKRHYDYVVESWTQSHAAPQTHSRRDSNGSHDLWRRLHLAPDAPRKVVDAAFRALASIHHPDRGGNAKEMVEINVAYEKILKEISP